MPLLKITLVKSLASHPEDQRRTAKALGLGKVNSSVQQQDNPAIRGMVTKLAHLIKVETVEQEAK